MKKAVRILFLLFVLTLSVGTFAFAESFSLSGMSYDELISLHKQISMAIMQSDEWKQVTIPVGTYVVGKDIPAGDYTVTYAGSYMASIDVYSNSGKYESAYLLSALYENFSIGRLSLSDGQVLKIQHGKVVFSPYKGLGF